MLTVVGVRGCVLGHLVASVCVPLKYLQGLLVHCNNWDTGTQGGWVRELGLYTMESTVEPRTNYMSFLGRLSSFGSHNFCTECNSNP